MILNWYSPVWGHHNGYGNAAEQMVRALERRGHSVGILEQGSMTFSGPCDTAWIRAHKPHRRAKVGVYFTLPTTWMSTYPVDYGFSMYESTELPAEWLPHLDRVDEIWVPSTYSAEIFGKYSRRPIYVIPLGVNPDFFVARRAQKSDGIFRFLHIAATHGALNKGAELAVEAFVKAFPGDDSVRLVVQSSVGLAPASADPRIAYTSDAIPQERFAEYFSGFDAVLYTSKGEGFGLLPLEAAATGIPVFHTGQTGMRDYRDIGIVVPSNQVRAVGQPGEWFEIDTSALAESLRAFVASPDAVKAKALRQADEVRRRWSWERSAEAIERRLNVSESSLRRTPRGASAP